ncbi:MAG: citrate/2-methylcitrate synthase [Myxococcota bacterium]
MLDEAHEHRLEDALRLAAGCGAEPSLLLTVALAFLDADTVDDALEQLIARRESIARVASNTPAPPRGLASAPEGPALAGMRLEVADHEIRGRLLFAELGRQKTFMQVVALAIAGLELSDEDAGLVEQIAISVQVADPRIWPLTVVRQAAASGRPLGARVIAGIATLSNPYMAAIPVVNFFGVLGRIEAAEAEGSGLETWLDQVLATGERLPGVGRPVLEGVDERIPPMLEAARRCGRHEGPSVRLALALERELMARKGIRLNAAGVLAALMRDLGFEANAAGAFTLLCLMVPVLMHAALAADHG